MNFYTVAARMYAQAHKYAGNKDTVKMHGGDYWRAFNHDLTTSLATHERIMDLGVQLLESFKSRATKSRHYMITVRPPDNGVSFEQFKRDVLNFIGDFEHYELAFEQKGESEETMGKGFHAHMIVRGITDQHFPSKILRNAQRAFGYVKANCIQVDTLRNLERARAYIRGDKNEENKKVAVMWDREWRAKRALCEIYASGQVQPLAISLAEGPSAGRDPLGDPRSSAPPPEIITAQLPEKS